MPWGATASVATWTNTANVDKHSAVGQGRVYQDAPSRAETGLARRGYWYRGRCYAASVTWSEQAEVGDGPAAGGESAAESGESAVGRDTEGDTEGLDTEGLVDLLGLLAYAELVAFFRLSEDAALAPTLADKVALGRMAVAEFSHFERIYAELDRLGVDPGQAMQPFRAPVDDFHARTAPSDWVEGLVKAYVGDGIAADFYRAVAELLDPRPRELVLGVLADTGHARFAVERVRSAIEADPKVAGRLALWARRLLGEALGQAQRVAAERPPLASLLVRHASAPGEAVAADEGSQLGEIGRMFARLTDSHARRMRALGLAG
jgi:hypothetical protein